MKRSKLKTCQPSLWDSSIPRVYPAINRWAITGCPSGTDSDVFARTLKTAATYKRFLHRNPTLSQRQYHTRILKIIDLQPHLSAVLLDNHCSLVTGADSRIQRFFYAARTDTLSALCATLSSTPVLLQTRASSFTGRFIAPHGAVIGTAVTDGFHPQANMTTDTTTIATESRGLVLFRGLSSRCESVKNNNIESASKQ